MSPRSTMPSVCLFLLRAVVCTAPLPSAQGIASPPLHAADAAAVQRALKFTGIEIPATDKVFYTFGGLSAQLETPGIERRSLEPRAVHHVGRENQFFCLVHHEQSRVLAIAGNGPWLPNAALVELAALPGAYPGRACSRMAGASSPSRRSQAGVCAPETRARRSRAAHQSGQLSGSVIGRSKLWTVAG